MLGNQFVASIPITGFLQQNRLELFKNLLLLGIKSRLFLAWASKKHKKVFTECPDKSLNCLRG